MELKHTAMRRAWLGLVAGAGLMHFAVPALAAGAGGPPPCTAKARVDMASVTIPDFVQNASGAWVPNAVEINGTGSQPKTSEGGSYLWSYGGTVLGTLSNATTPKVLLTAPDVLGASRQTTVRLTVSSAACGSDSIDIPVTITNAHDVVQNTAPRARPTASPATATEGTTVTLDGSSSSDPENDPLTYAWTQTEGPAVALSPSDHPGKRTFVAPNFAADTPLTFRLTVSDGKLEGTDVTYVTIGWTNDAPTAALQCADGVIAVDEGGPVFLDGRASADPDDGIAAYEWQQLVGLPALPALGADPTATFAAPSLGYQQTGFVPVKLTVTDRSGAKASAECTVAIRDVTRPLISVPGPLTREASSAAGAHVPYVATAFDAVDGDLPVGTPNFRCEAPSGALFPLDTLTPVLCDARDTAGNAASAGFSIRVVDTTAPTLIAPASLAREATGPDGATAIYTVTSSDAVDGEKDATCTPASGSTFPINAPGPVTTVSCGITDAHGNAATPVTFEVAIHDTTPPAIDTGTVSADIVQEATSAAGAVALFAPPTALDIVDRGNVTVACLPASGSTFGLGETTVACDAIDSRGNSTRDESPATSATFTVTVRDTTPPALSGVPADLVAEAQSSVGAPVTFALPTARDLVDGTRPVACSPGSGALFAIGQTRVECIAADSVGNQASASFQVRVQDTTAPTLTLPGALTAEATGPSGAPVAFTAFAVDTVDPGVAFACSANPGDVFPLGSTTVSCTGTDDSGNTARGSFTVTVQDTTAPTLTLPAALTAEATGPSGAAATFTASAVDTVDSSVAIACSANSGDTFALGTTTVSCTGTDDAGNVARGSFDVTVQDTTAPVLTLPAPIVAEATSASGAQVAFSASVTDAVGATLACSANPGDTFPIGTTTVACTGRDAAGNVARGGFSVTVQDTTDPVVTVPASILAEATGPSGARVTFAASVSDAVGATLSCTPTSGVTFPLGTTAVVCTGTDAAGNDGSGRFEVTVRDTTAPVIAAHDDVTATATADSSALVSYALPTAADLVDGTVPVSCTPASGESFPAGTTTVTCTAIDAHGNSSGSSFAVKVGYAFSGFFQPVDTAALNTVKAGSAVPVKFSLAGYQGLSVFAAASPSSSKGTCGATAEDVIEETVAAGGSSLQYDATAGQYVYVWKTDKTWVGTCRTLQLKFKDGTSRTANFKFK